MKVLPQNNVVESTTTVFRQIVYDIVTNNRNTDATLNLRKAILDLELGKVDPELLKRSNRLSRNPEEYGNENDRKRKIGLTILRFGLDKDTRYHVTLA